MIRFPALTSASILSVALCAGALPAFAQDRALAFSLSAGVQSAPAYLGASRMKLGPDVGFGFQRLRLGGFDLGDVATSDPFLPGTALRGGFRILGARDGKDELAGMTDIKTAVELGIGVQHTTRTWQVYGEVRRGLTGHSGIAGDLGANLIFRPLDGLTLHAGPRASFGNARFNRTYFGVTAAEAVTSGLAAYRPGAGVHSVGFEVGAYQALNRDWGVNALIRYDNIRGDAAASPIVQQGKRDQVTATIGLTRNFNFRF